MSETQADFETPPLAGVDLPASNATPVVPYPVQPNRNENASEKVLESLQSDDLKKNSVKIVHELPNWYDIIEEMEPPCTCPILCCMSTYASEANRAFDEIFLVPFKVINKEESFVGQIPNWDGEKMTTNDVEFYKEPNKKFYDTTQWKCNPAKGTFPMEYYTQVLKATDTTLQMELYIKSEKTKAYEFANETLVELSSSERSLKITVKMSSILWMEEWLRSGKPCSGRVSDFRTVVEYNY